jgi:hypothetical protein
MWWCLSPREPNQVEVGTPSRKVRTQIDTGEGLPRATAAGAQRCFVRLEAQMIPAVVRFLLLPLTASGAVG